MYFLSIFFLLSSFFTLSLFGRYLGNFYVSLLSILYLFLSLLISIFIFYEVVVLGFSCYICFGDWVDFGLLNYGFGLYFDKLSSSMFFIVLIISFFVQLYSIYYMFEDPHFIRFFSYLTLFTLFMSVIVLSDNFVLFFFG